MTLGDLANYICTKLGQTDEASMAAGKLFLRRRYQMIWDYALWKESLFVVPFNGYSSLDPGYTIGVLPPSVNQVLAIRLAQEERTLPELDQTTLMQTDPGEYTRPAGAGRGFSFLSCTCVNYPPGATAKYFGAHLQFRSASNDDTTQLIHLAGEQANGQEARETLALTGMTWATTVYSYANPYSISLSAPTAGTVTVVDDSGQTDPPLAELRPGEVSLPQRPRLRLFESGDAVFYALAKRACVDLLDDGALPMLRNCENALLAYATGDMLERQRQYAKAQLKLKEGEAQLQTLLDLERNQSANVQRIIPAEIHGSAAPGVGGKGIW